MLEIDKNHKTEVQQAELEVPGHLPTPLRY